MALDKEQRIKLLENGLELLRERVDEILYKTGELTEEERGILRSAIQQIREHEEKLEELRNEF